MSATALRISVEYSIPVLIAATGKASKSSLTCSTTREGSMPWIALTFPGTSATTQVTAVSP